MSNITIFLMKNFSYLKVEFTAASSQSGGGYFIEQMSLQIVNSQVT